MCIELLSYRNHIEISSVGIIFRNSNRDSYKNSYMYRNSHRTIGIPIGILIGIGRNSYTVGSGFELTVCNVQFAHRFGPNSKNCISLFKMICKFLLPSVKAYNPTVAIDLLKSEKKLHS